MQPDTTPFRPAARHLTCVDCDGQLEPGQQLRCVLCVSAAEQAVRESTVTDGPRQVIRPSDVAAVRERLG